MLTAIQEGYWKASDSTIKDIANTWAKATVQNGVACCDCSCGNIAMMQWAAQYVNPDILAQLLPKLYEATKNPVFLNNTQSNVPPQDDNSKQPNKEASTTNPVKGSTSSATVVSNSTSSTNTQSYSQSSQNSQGQALSNVGVNGESGDVASASSQGADVKKAIEINPVTSQSASEVGLSIIAVLGILSLIAIIGVGYFRNRDEKEITDLDKLFDEKL